MNFSTFIGIKNANIDIETGEEMKHRDIYKRAIQRFGGLEAVKPYIPFTLKEIKKALVKDEHLNNLSMTKWDRAASFYTKWGDCMMIYAGLIQLYSKYNINVFSCSDGVCLLKEAAREWAEEEE